VKAGKANSLRIFLWIGILQKIANHCDWGRGSSSVDAKGAVHRGGEARAFKLTPKDFHTFAEMRLWESFHDPPWDLFVMAPSRERQLLMTHSFLQRSTAIQRKANVKRGGRTQNAKPERK